MSAARETATPTLGFVGLGRMGGNIAARLLDAGCDHRDIAALFEVLDKSS